MKWIIVISVIISFLLGFFLGYYGFKSDPKIRIVETVVYKTQYFADPQSLKDYKECYESPITVTAEAHDDKIDIYATDACKSVEAEIGVACGQRLSLKTGAVIFGVGVAAGMTIFLLIF